MTASIDRASQASQFWTRTSAFTITSDNDYLICAVLSGDRWSFVASSPKVRIKRPHNGEAEYFQGVEYKVQYSLGDKVPPSFGFREREAREHIGTFNQHDYAGTDQARDAAMCVCDEHLAQSRVLPEPKPCGPGTPRNLASDSPNTLPNTDQVEVA